MIYRTTVTRYCDLVDVVTRWFGWDYRTLLFTAGCCDLPRLPRTDVVVTVDLFVYSYRLFTLRTFPDTVTPVCPGSRYMTTLPVGYVEP